MPGIVESIILGIIQGLTEFLPISSDGHLVVIPSLLGWHEPTISFDLVLHAGTLLAVLFYFRTDLIALARGVLGQGERTEVEDHRRLFGWLLLATIPVGIAGLTLRDRFESLFEQPLWACLFWGVTALILVLGELGHRAAPRRELSTRIVIAIGLAQTLSPLPGVSRSASTIAVGIALGVSRQEATRFSFLLAIPAISGAVLTSIPDIASGNMDTGPLVVGFLAAGAVGYVAIAALLRIVRTRSFLPFAAYLAIVAPLAALAL